MRPASPLLLRLALAACLMAGVRLALAQDPEPTEPAPGEPPAVADAVPQPETGPEPDEEPEPGPEEDVEEEPQVEREIPFRGRDPGQEPEDRVDGRVPAPAASPANPTVGIRAERPERGDRSDSNARPGRRDRRERRESAPATDGSTNAPTTFDPTELAAFKLIADRNIFDPKRTRRSAGEGPRPPSRPDPVVETLGVVGILEGSRGTVAFFDGSSPAFRQSLRADATIAGFRVAGITGDLVRLADGDRVIEVAVGSHVRREDGGDWEVRSGAASSARAGSGSRSAIPMAADAPGTGTATEPTGPGSGGDGGPSDALKRLLQKRQQEINR